MPYPLHDNEYTDVRHENSRTWESAEPSGFEQAIESITTGVANVVRNTFGINGREVRTSSDRTVTTRYDERGRPVVSESTTKTQLRRTGGKTVSQVQHEDSFTAPDYKKTDNYSEIVDDTGRRGEASQVEQIREYSPRSANRAVYTVPSTRAIQDSHRSRRQIEPPMSLSEIHVPSNSGPIHSLVTSRPVHMDARDTRTIVYRQASPPPPRRRESRRRSSGFTSGESTDRSSELVLVRRHPRASNDEYRAGRSVSNIRTQDHERYYARERSNYRHDGHTTLDPRNQRVSGSWTNRNHDAQRRSNSTYRAQPPLGNTKAQYYTTDEEIEYRTPPGTHYDARLPSGFATSIDIDTGRGSRLKVRHDDQYDPNLAYPPEARYVSSSRSDSQHLTGGHIFRVVSSDEGDIAPRPLLRRRKSQIGPQSGYLTTDEEWEDTEIIETRQPNSKGYKEPRSDFIGYPHYVRVDAQIPPTQTSVEKKSHVRNNQDSDDQYRFDNFAGRRPEVYTESALHYQKSEKHHTKGKSKADPRARRPSDVRTKEEAASLLYQQSEARANARARRNSAVWFDDERPSIDRQATPKARRKSHGSSESEYYTNIQVNTHGPTSTGIYTDPRVSVKSGYEPQWNVGNQSEKAFPGHPFKDQSREQFPAHGFRRYGHEGYAVDRDDSVS